MISSSCSFSEFIKSVNARDYLDLMYKTELEATEAERCRFKAHMPPDKKQNRGEQYAETLKNFLFFLRYGVRPAGIGKNDFDLFCRTGKKYQPDLLH